MINEKGPEQCEDALNLSAIIDKDSTSAIKETITNNESDKHEDTSQFITTIKMITSVWKEEREAQSKLKKNISMILIFTLVTQLVIINFIIFFIGFNYINIEQWTLRLYITGVFVEVVAVIKIILKSLFPESNNGDMIHLIEETCKKLW